MSNALSTWGWWTFPVPQRPRATESDGVSDPARSAPSAERHAAATVRKDRPRTRPSPEAILRKHSVVASDMQLQVVFFCLAVILGTICSYALGRALGWC